MDQISASWEYQEDYNVLNFTNMDDPGQPYSCSAWGNQGSLSDNLMTEDGNGYSLFNDFNSQNGFPSNVFIDHNMVVYYKCNNLSYYLGNLKIEDMLEACEADAGANCFQCDDCDEDGTYDDVDNCPDLFNPSQDDSDGDGLGDECDDCHNLMGDINDDLNIDVLDIVSVVNIILTGGINSTEFSECAKIDANIDANSAINILDVIQIINMVLGSDRLGETETSNYAVAQVFHDKGDLLVRIEADSDVSGIEFTIKSDSFYPIELKDNSHIETYSNYFDNTLKVVSFNAFNESFDSHVIEYRFLGAASVNQDDVDITIASPSANEFYVTTNSNGESEEFIVSSYLLHDVYPNPFNPTTQVSFTLPQDGYVGLHVYDLKGEQVDTIYEGFQINGTHSYTWDASALSSGVYYIQMISNNATLSVKAMLLK